MSIPTHFNLLRRMRPEFFAENNYDSFLFVLSDGQVLHKDVVVKLLRDAAVRLGLSPKILASHSLRAGGCSAMFNAGTFSEAEIQRRGRWVTSCWKAYAWSARQRKDDVADRMAAADSNLMAF